MRPVTRRARTNTASFNKLFFEVGRAPPDDDWTSTESGGRLPPVGVTYGAAESWKTNGDAMVEVAEGRLLGCICDCSQTELKEMCGLCSAQQGLNESVLV